MMAIKRTTLPQQQRFDRKCVQEECCKYLSEIRMPILCIIVENQFCFLSIRVRRENWAFTINSKLPN